MRWGSVFTGVGLLDLGLAIAGIEHAWFCEAVPFRREILSLRWPGVPIHDDIRTLTDPEPVEGIVGGFPCKGVSSAGKGEGFGHPETALWREMRRVIRLLRPRYVLVENVAALTSKHKGRLIGEVLGDLAESGYDTDWDCIPASALGAPHGRDRIFVVGHTDEPGLEGTAEREVSGNQPAEADAGSDAHPHKRSLRAGRNGSGGDQDQAGAGVAADPERTRLEGPGLRGSASEHADTAPAHPDSSGWDGPDSQLRAQPDADGGAITDSECGRHPTELSTRNGRQAASSSKRHGSDASDTESQRGSLRPAPRERLGGSASDRDGTDWGIYRAAIERWEEILGRPAPQPLLRRVDDGRPRGVDRSRLSALGDGVQVQVGELVGRRILEWEAQREPVPSEGGRE